MDHACVHNRSPLPVPGIWARGRKAVVASIWGPQDLRDPARALSIAEDDMVRANLLKGLETNSEGLRLLFNSNGNGTKLIRSYLSRPGNSDPLKLQAIQTLTHYINETQLETLSQTGNAAIDQQDGALRRDFLKNICSMLSEAEPAKRMALADEVICQSGFIYQGKGDDKTLRIDPYDKASLTANGSTLTNCYEFLKRNQLGQMLYGLLKEEGFFNYNEELANKALELKREGPVANNANVQVALGERHLRSMGLVTEANPDCTDIRVPYKGIFKGITATNDDSHLSKLELEFLAKTGLKKPSEFKFSFQDMVRAFYKGPEERNAAILDYSRAMGVLNLRRNMIAQAPDLNDAHIYSSWLGIDITRSDRQTALDAIDRQLKLFHIIPTDPSVLDHSGRIQNLFGELVKSNLTGYLAAVGHVSQLVDSIREDSTMFRLTQECDYNWGRSAPSYIDEQGNLTKAVDRNGFAKHAEQTIEAENEIALDTANALLENVIGLTDGQLIDTGLVDQFYHILQTDLEEYLDSGAANLYDVTNPEAVEENTTRSEGRDRPYAANVKSWFRDFLNAHSGDPSVSYVTNRWDEIFKTSMDSFKFPVCKDSKTYLASCLKELQNKQKNSLAIGNQVETFIRAQGTKAAMDRLIATDMHPDSSLRPEERLLRNLILERDRREADSLGLTQAGDHGFTLKYALSENLREDGIPDPAKTLIGVMEYLRDLKSHSGNPDLINDARNYIYRNLLGLKTNQIPADNNELYRLNTILGDHNRDLPNICNNLLVNNDFVSVGSQAQLVFLQNSRSRITKELNKMDSTIYNSRENLAASVLRPVYNSLGFSETDIEQMAKVQELFSGIVDNIDSYNSSADVDQRDEIFAEIKNSIAKIPLFKEFCRGSFTTDDDSVWVSDFVSNNDRADYLNKFMELCQRILQEIWQNFNPSGKTEIRRLEDSSRRVPPSAIIGANKI